LKDELFLIIFLEYQGNCTCCIHQLSKVKDVWLDVPDKNKYASWLGTDKPWTHQQGQKPGMHRKGKTDRQNRQTDSQADNLPASV
jgi:hypothetical protein